jgi:hypothetical protein
MIYIDLNHIKIQNKNKNQKILIIECIKIVKVKRNIIKKVKIKENRVNHK